MTKEVNKFEVIEKKLDVLINLVAMTVGVGQSTADRAPMLQRSGLDRAAIAAVCDTTVESVSVRLAEAKRKKLIRKRKG